MLRKKDHKPHYNSFPTRSPRAQCTLRWRWALLHFSNILECYNISRFVILHIYAAICRCCFNCRHSIRLSLRATTPARKRSIAAISPRIQVHPKWPPIMRTNTTPPRKLGPTWTSTKMGTLSLLVIREKIREIFTIWPILAVRLYFIHFRVRLINDLDNWTYRKKTFFWSLEIVLLGIMIGLRSYFI